MLRKPESEDKDSASRVKYKINSFIFISERSRSSVSAKGIKKLTFAKENFYNPRKKKNKTKLKTCLYGK